MNMTILVFAVTLVSPAAAGAVVGAFVAGCMVGSFLNVVVHRVPKGETVVFGRSHCPSCGAMIRAYDNVPVISWLLLRGRCRDCGAAISPRYPLVEAACGCLAAAATATLIIVWDPLTRAWAAVGRWIAGG